MKSFVRSVLIFLVACTALSEVQADSFAWRTNGDAAGRKRHDHDRGADAVVIGESYKLETGESTNGAVVLIGANGEINGTVNGDLILVGGKAIFAGTVNGDFITIASNLRIDSGAVANGDYVSVGSEVKGEQELTANGERITSNDFSPAVPFFKEALTHIVQLRPMSPSSIFSWALAIVTIIVRLLLGLFFPNVLARTELILRNRPGPSFLIGLAVVFGGVMLSFLLAITVVGIIALPFLALVLFVLNVFGCTAVCYTIGRRIAPQVAERSYGVYVWIVLGTVLIWVLYCIPVVGFIAAGVISLLGLGTFAIYILERYRTDTPQPLLPSSAASDTQNSRTMHSGSLTLPSVEPAMAPSAPRAQFLPRLFANVIDLTVLYALLNSLHLSHAVIPAWVLYRFGMFAWKSSTLGQIVLNLQVQKPDGSSLIADYSSALTRALSSLVSLIPLGLGFVWILFNRDLEAWHDKISETYVVRRSPSAARSTTPN